MALADLVPKGVSLGTPQGDLVLYPLTLEDLAVLARDYLPVMTGVVDNDIDVAGLVSDSPDFVAAMIAMSAREPDGVDYAKVLPVGVQLKAVEMIWDISVLEAEEIANFIKRLLEGMTLMSQKVTGLNQ